MTRNALSSPEEAALGRYEVPYPRLPLRVGRGDDLRRIRERLSDGRITVLRGVRPGIGATRLAAEYAHDHVDAYAGGVIWLPYRNSSAREAAADIVEAFGLPGAGELRWPFVTTDGAMGRMWRSLEDHPTLLVVLDGFAEWDDAATWTPPPNTRAHVLAIAGHARRDDAATMEVGDLRREDVRAVTSEPSALALASDPLNLDLILAGGRGLPDDVASLPPDAASALAALSVLDAEPVPMSLLEALLEPDGVSCPEAIAQLTARRLVCVSSLNEVIVHSRVLEAAARTTDASFVCRAATALSAAFKNAPVKALHWRRRLAPHARRVLRAVDPTAADDDVAELAFAVSADGARRHLYGEREAAMALDLARRSEAVPGKRTLRALLNAGHVASEARRLSDAQSVLREAVSVAEELHGPESIEVATVLDDLARAIGLAVCGTATDEELELEERALAIREKIWGAEDERLMDSVWGLGIKMLVVGRHADARSCVERAVRIARRVNSTWLPHYLDSLAMCLAADGSISDALSAIDESVDWQFAAGAFKRVASTIRAAEEILQKAGDNVRIAAIVQAALDRDEWDVAAAEHAEPVALLRAIRARALSQSGHANEAAREARSALPVLERRYGAEASVVAEMRQLASFVADGE